LNLRAALLGIFVVLTVLLASTTVYELGIRTTLTSTSMLTVTVTVSTIPTAYQELANASTNHLVAIESRNVTALLLGYESNATLHLMGNAPGLAGTYHGVSEIAALLNVSFPARIENLTLADINQTVIGPQESYWVVNSSFNWEGYSVIDGSVSGTILAQDIYVHQANGTWAIANETWDSTRYYCMFPSCHF
jgi:hypothetical protein